MKKYLKVTFFMAIVAMMIGCGSHKKRSKKAAAKETMTREQYLFAKSDLIFDEFKAQNKGSVSDFTLDYIGKYKNIAIRKMMEYKIPASITLAQGILESGNGLSTLARKSNNHFGIKCHSGWKGKKVYHDDDKRNECFRKYDSPEGSFNDHSMFLTSRGRYEFLFDLRPDDYKGWAKGLKKAGYATDRKYPRKLISFIENFELYKYDALVLDEKGYKKSQKQERMPVAEKETPVVNNSSRFITVDKGDTLYSIAKNNDLSVEELKAMNRLNSNNISIGQKLQVAK